jgi:hypothetical protein
VRHEDVRRSSRRRPLNGTVERIAAILQLGGLVIVPCGAASFVVSRLGGRARRP